MDDIKFEFNDLISFFTKNGFEWRWFVSLGSRIFYTILITLLIFKKKNLGTYKINLK